MRLYDGWEPLMASRNPVEFCGHMHCGSGDTILVVEGQDYT